MGQKQSQVDTRRSSKHGSVHPKQHQRRQAVAPILHVERHPFRRPATLLGPFPVEIWEIILGYLFQTYPLSLAALSQCSSGLNSLCIPLLYSEVLLHSGALRERARSMQNPRIHNVVQNITLSLNLAEDREAKAVASLINGCSNIKSLSLVIDKKSDNPFTPEVLCEALQGMKALKNVSLIAGDANFLLSRPLRKARLDYLHITNLWLWPAQFKLASAAGQKLKDSIRTKTLDLRLFRPEHDDWNGFFPLAVAGRWLRKLILQWVVMPGSFLTDFASMLGREGKLEELHIDRCWYRTRTSLVLSDLLFPLRTLKTLRLGAESRNSPYTLAPTFLQQKLYLSPALEALEILHLQKPLLTFLALLLPVLPTTHSIILPSPELAFANVWDDRAFDGPLTKGNIEKRHVWLDDRLAEDWKLATETSKRAELKQILLDLDEAASGKQDRGRFIDLLAYRPPKYPREEDEQTKVVKASVQRFMIVAGQQRRLYG